MRLATSLTTALATAVLGTPVAVGLSSPAAAVGDNVCALTAPHHLQVTLPRRVDVTIDRDHGRVRVSDHTCSADGHPVRVADLAALAVRVVRSPEVTGETVRLPDVVAWRSDQAAAPSGRVRVRVDLGRTDYRHDDETTNKFDRVVVLTCGTWGNVFRFLPPLSISDALLHEAFDVVAEAFASTS